MQITSKNNNVMIDTFGATTDMAMIPRIVREIGLVIAGSILIALAAQFYFPLPFSPVPITGQTSAVPFFNPGSSCLAMTYYGAEKAVPHYNVMGVAKAALEASVRYLAVDLGPLSHRVNAISAGPIRTLAAAGVSGFKSMHSEFVDIAPLRRNVTNDDVGNAAVYLSSDLASGVTGEVHYVDSGFNIVGVTTPSCMVIIVED